MPQEERGVAKEPTYDMERVPVWNSEMRRKLVKAEFAVERVKQNTSVQGRLKAGL